MKMSILEEAKDIIYGDREKTYGHPSKNLESIAKMWNAYLTSRLRPIDAKDVANMMILLKVARLANSPDHRDSMVDICGYAALIERCDELTKPDPNQCPPCNGFCEQGRKCPSR